MVVKYRKAQISLKWEEELYKYITGIVQTKGHKMLAINGMPDHIHIFINFNPEYELSALVREVKKSSNYFINKNEFTQEKFYWQAGYGAFSYSHSHLTKVINYIQGQKGHHQNKKTKDEYIQLLRRYEIEFREKYLFNWID
jgi:putative transposase